MSNLLKQNRPMIATITSGLLILLGILLSYLQFFSASVVIYLLSFLIGGFYQAKEGFIDTFTNKHLNVDILMVLAAVGASLIGYWMEGALLIFIFSLSGSLEVYATNKSKSAIADLMRLTPETAQLIQSDHSTVTVGLDQVAIGDQLLVPKGSAIPIDGVLTSATALIDEAAITGEAIPVEKNEKAELIGGTLNLGEAISMQVTKDQSHTLFAKIVRLVEEAQSVPSKTATFLEKIENTYVKAVLIFVPVMIAVFYFLFHWSFEEAFYRGMVLLTVASPCALVASATPAALSAISNAAKKGMLFKGGSYMENFGELDAIAFDKTGTLTEGKPYITDSFFKNQTEKEQILAHLVAIEKHSTHPLAEAVVTAFKDQLSASIQPDHLEDKTGFGLIGTFDHSSWYVGKKSFVLKDNETAFSKQAELLQKEGKTVIYVSRDQEVIAYFGLMDQPKEGAKEMIQFFKQQGVRTILITGDQEATGQTIGTALGIDEIYANTLPDEKAELILSLQEKYGIVAMVGDGVNDAPALANASIGVAMGAGTDIAMESADVVLVQNDLDQLTFSYQLSKQLKNITFQNIVFSISVILLLIISNIFQVITLPLGVIGHEGSTILVILNGLRLLSSKKGLRRA